MAKGVLTIEDKKPIEFPKSKYVKVTDRDLMKEAMFKDAYGVDTKIKSTTYNDEKWNWDMVVLNFRDTLGKNYGLVEYFKPGEDNSTDHVDFEFEDKEGTWKTIRFDETNSDKGSIFFAAETAMKEMMQRRLRGED